MLSDAELDSARSLTLNFKERLGIKYRHSLSRLVQKATKLKALDALRDIQHAARMLEQEHYSNLDELEQLLLNKMASDKSLKINARRAQKFNQALEKAKQIFEVVAPLNNDDVQSAHSILNYLSNQNSNFSQVSSVLQDELTLLLKEVSISLKRLTRESKATALIALQILTSDTFDDTFDNFDEIPPLSPKVQGYYPENKNLETPIDLKN